MIRTMYICDKCKVESESHDQFWTVGVTANHSVWSANERDYVKGMSLQVCRPCLEAFGIYAQKKPDPASEGPKPPTLEELIIEIVRNHTSG